MAKTIEEIDAQLVQLKNEKKVIRQLHSWTGQAGIWRAFRNIGREFYNDKDLTSEQKGQRLQADIENFLNERFPE